MGNNSKDHQDKECHDKSFNIFESMSHGTNYICSPHGQGDVNKRKMTKDSLSMSPGPWFSKYF